MEEPNTARSLIEPSVAGALTAIEAAEDLSGTAPALALLLAHPCQGLGRPPELLPARWTAVRIPISRLHHAQLGVTPKTLANHKANVRAAS